MPTYLYPGVYVEEVDSGSRPIEGVGTAVAAFVGFSKSGPFHRPTLVSNWKQYVATFGDFTGSSYLPHAVYGWFQNGGGNCFVVRVGSEGEAEAARGALSALGDGDAPAPQFAVRAKELGPAGNDITVEVSDASGPDAPEEAFKLTISKPRHAPEVFDNLSPKRGKGYVVTQVRSQLVELLDQTSGGGLRPANGTVSLAGGAEGGDAPVRASDYVGDSADRTGFGGLEAIDEITMVAVPDLVTALENGAVDLEGFNAVQAAMIAHCELMGDRVAVLDAPPGLRPQQLLDWRMSSPLDSKYAALYWPRIKVFDPARNENIFVPPSGHVAGVWGRNDDTRGVHKAPANEVIRGAIALECDLTAAEQGLLNPQGINCIRAFPGRGIRVWGARTLSSDPAWRYLNVRRLFNYLEESILNGTQWVVFEPNDDALWSKIRRTIVAFLANEWRKGALFGLTPDEAFFVKCDRESNTQESIDLGQVICEIGVCPVKPAEFVIFRLSQFSGGASVAE